MYGNYDGLNKLPIFDLYLGVNFWKTVNISDPGSGTLIEVITVAPDEFMQVCLVNTGGGIPFISVLDLRPLKNILYPAVNATQSLVLFRRLNVGPTNDVAFRLVGHFMLLHELKLALINLQSVMKLEIASFDF